MDKVINLNHTVYELYQEYPEILEILKELGFHDIVKPGMLQTAGRFMTIPKISLVYRIFKLVLKNFQKLVFTTRKKKIYFFHTWRNMVLLHRQR